MVYSANVASYDLNVQTPNQPTNYKNVIHLRLTLTSGAAGIAFLYFVPEGGALGTNGKRASGNYFDIYFWMGAWAQLVDLLRNEKPVRFFFDDGNKTAVIQTGDEPVGEQEAR
jgi:hypothetical protein